MDLSASGKTLRKYWYLDISRRVEVREVRGSAEEILAAGGDAAGVGCGADGRDIGRTDGALEIVGSGRAAAKAHLVFPRMCIGEQLKERARVGRIVTPRTPPTTMMAVQPVSDRPGHELSYLLEPGVRGEGRAGLGWIARVARGDADVGGTRSYPDEAEIGRLRGSRVPLMQTRIGAGPGSNPGAARRQPRVPDRVPPQAGKLGPLMKGPQ